MLSLDDLTLVNGIAYPIVNFPEEHDLIAKCKSSGMLVIEVSGSQGAQVAFQLPGLLLAPDVDFGNWNALSDILSDLSWITATGVLICMNIPIDIFKDNRFQRLIKIIQMSSTLVRDGGKMTILVYLNVV